MLLDSHASCTIRFKRNFSDKKVIAVSSFLFASSSLHHDFWLLFLSLSRHRAVIYRSTLVYAQN